MLVLQVTDAGVRRPGYEVMLWPSALGLIVQERAFRFFIGHCPLCVYPLPT